MNNIWEKHKAKAPTKDSRNEGWHSTPTSTTSKYRVFRPLTARYETRSSLHRPCHSRTRGKTQHFISSCSASARTPNLLFFYTSRAVESYRCHTRVSVRGNYGTPPRLARSGSSFRESRNLLKEQTRDTDRYDSLHCGTLVLLLHAYTLPPTTPSPSHHYPSPTEPTARPPKQTSARNRLNRS